MSPRDLGVVLLWGGALVLALALIARIRAGAWSAAALDRTPPPGWPTRLAVLTGGLMLVAALVLILGSFR